MSPESLILLRSFDEEINKSGRMAFHQSGRIDLRISSMKSWMVGASVIHPTKWLLAIMKQTKSHKQKKFDCLMKMSQKNVRLALLHAQSAVPLSLGLAIALLFTFSVCCMEQNRTLPKTTFFQWFILALAAVHFVSNFSQCFSDTSWNL